jgi:hypothetical protein
LFGIKNAGRSAREDELVVSRGVNQTLAFGPVLRLLNNDIILGDHAVKLPRARKGLIISGLTVG